MSPFPLVILGDSYTGFGGDDLFTAFAKYNVHTHPQLQESLAYAYPLRFNDILTISPSAPDSVFGSSPGNLVVQELTATQVRLNRSATQTAEILLLKNSQPVGKWQTTQGSSWITPISVAGSVPSKTVGTSRRIVFTDRFIAAPRPFVILLGIEAPFVLYRFSAVARHGSAVLALIRPTIDLTLFTADSTKRNRVFSLQSEAQNTFFLPNEDVSIRVSNVVGEAVEVFCTVEGFLLDND